MIKSVRLDGSGHIDTRVRSEPGACPNCQHSPTQMHSRYLRRLAEAPITARAMVLPRREHQFYCNTLAHTAQTFVEQLTGLTSPHARCTGPRRRIVETTELALVGRASAA